GRGDPWFAVGGRRRVSCRRMADSLDVVAIGIEDEGGVIVGMIMRPEPRLAIVAPACRNRSHVEFIHDLAAIGGKGDVHMSFGLFAGADPEIRLLSLAEPRRRTISGLLGRDFHDDPDAERP